MVRLDEVMHLVIRFKIIISHYSINYISLNNDIMITIFIYIRLGELYIMLDQCFVYETTNRILIQHKILIEWTRDHGET